MTAIQRCAATTFLVPSMAKGVIPTGLGDAEFRAFASWAYYFVPPVGTGRRYVPYKKIVGRMGWR